MKKELELYVHIPFCIRKCAYCDFLSAPADTDTIRQYVTALLQEIREFPSAEEYEVSTLFFGGGTPSILPSDWIGEILDALDKKFCFCRREATNSGPRGKRKARDVEITIECNPGTADFEKLHAYRLMGVNRLSLGLQSADDQELKCLGRIHTWEEFLCTYDAARRAGFENISIDLMSALPGQTVDSWVNTLKKVLVLEPEHISAYSLIVEEGTPFYERYDEDVKRREAGEVCHILPSEEDERSMYEKTEQYLAAAGMYRYEISNYAKPGFECRHNCGYWKRTEYVGFGLGASSLLKNVRYHNPEDLLSYISKDFSGRKKEVLSIPDQMSEFMFLGLRMTEGVSEQKFFDTFGIRIEEIYSAPLQKMTVEKLLCRKEGRICLTDRGRDLANIVMAEFLF